MSPQRLPHLELVLASKSPARLATLRAAGIDPLVRVSSADEAAILDGICAGPAGQVMALAVAKALDVVDALRAENPAFAGERPASGPDGTGTPGTSGTLAPLVLGCDSMLEIDGEVWGKPHTPELARERLRAMSGNSGILHTGHCLVNTANRLFTAAVSHARVHIAPMTDAEIDAYVATGEPLHVAGSFTVDGLGGPFIDRVDGDYHGVVGLSLPLLRQLMSAHGLSLTQLWTSNEPAFGALDEHALHFLASERTFLPARDSDGFLLCGCGQRHWGLGGAAGLAAFRERDGQREVLLQLRSPWSHGGATWGVPGGAIEWCESPWEGAVREFAEETGIEAELLRPVAASGPDSAPDVSGSTQAADSPVVPGDRPAFGPDADLPAGCTRAEMGSLDGKVAHLDIHQDWTYATFVARCEAQAEARPNRESTELRWVSIDGPLPQPLHHAFAESWPALREAIARA